MSFELLNIQSNFDVRHFTKKEIFAFCRISTRKLLHTLFSYAFVQYRYFNTKYTVYDLAVHDQGAEYEKRQKTKLQAATSTPVPSPFVCTYCRKVMLYSHVRRRHNKKRCNPSSALTDGCLPRYAQTEHDQGAEYVYFQVQLNHLLLH